MSAAPGVPVCFGLRAEVLEASAVVGVGAAARALAERLLRHSDEQLRQWTGVGGPELIAVVGASDALPWVDGARYLGRDPRAPSLFLPTSLEPSNVAIELFERAVRARAVGLAAPLGVVVGAPPRIFSLADALPIRRERLLAWLGEAA